MDVSTDDPNIPTGSINEPDAPRTMPGSYSINEPGGGPMHTVTGLNPTDAEIGSPDITLSVFGTHFTEGAVIVFNNGAEATEWISDTELTTIVKPSLATVTGTFPVTVAQNGLAFEPALEFSFYEQAAAPEGARRRRR